MEYVGCPNAEGETPCGDEFPTNAGFPLEYSTMVEWFQRVHVISQGPSTLPRKMPVLINTRHMLVNSACCLKGVYKEAALAGHSYFVGGKQKQRTSNLSARASEFY